MAGGAWLLVFFWLDGQPYFLDGWHPREQPSIEICEEHAENIREFLESHTGWPEPWAVMCVGAAEGPGGQ